MKVKWQKPEIKKMGTKRERLSRRSAYGAACGHPNERMDGNESYGLRDR